jgi:phosphonate transport system substrate-binding protein
MLSRKTGQTLRFCALALAVVGAGMARADWRDDVTVFRVGVMTGANAPYRLVQLEPFKQYLESRLSLPVEIVPAESYDMLIADQTAERVDYAIESATAYATAKTRCDCVKALAVPTRANGEPGFYALIVGRTDSEIGMLADAGGKRLAVAGEDSIAGRLLQLKAFEAEGIVAETYFSEIIEVAHPEAAVTALLAGEADLAVAWSSLSGNRAAGYSFGVLADLVAEGKLTMDQINIVWQSSLIPFGPHVIRSTLPGELQRLVSDALLAIARDDPVALDSVDRFAGRGFVAADPGLFAPIVALIAPTDGPSANP